MHNPYMMQPSHPRYVLHSLMYLGTVTLRRAMCAVAVYGSLVLILQCYTLGYTFAYVPSVRYRCMRNLRLSHVLHYNTILPCVILKVS